MLLPVYGTDIESIVESVELENELLELGQQVMSYWIALTTS